MHAGRRDEAGSSDTYGGIDKRECQLSSGEVYPCYYIDAENRADPDANRNSFFDTPFEGNSSGKFTTPLARGFYVLTVPSGTAAYELRVWLDEDLPDFNTDVTAVRKFGQNSRPSNSRGLLWGTKVTLCDKTMHRGHCST